MIVSAKSLLPNKIKFASYRGQDLDILGKGMTQPATGEVSGFLKKDREPLDLLDVGAGGGAEVSTVFGCRCLKADAETKRGHESRTVTHMPGNMVWVQLGQVQPSGLSVTGVGGGDPWVTMDGERNESTNWDSQQVRLLPGGRESLLSASSLCNSLWGGATGSGVGGASASVCSNGFRQGH